jgi:hypothetical protein
MGEKEKERESDRKGRCLCLVRARLHKFPGLGATLEGTLHFLPYHHVQVATPANITANIANYDSAGVVDILSNITARPSLKTPRDRSVPCPRILSPSVAS